MGYRVKGWNKFQHFKDRRPLWIKLYRDILDDVEWHDLEPAAAKVLISCWLIASEYEGALPDMRTLAFRLRMSEKQATSILSQLHHWLIQDDSNMVSDGYQPDNNLISSGYQFDALEKETEKRREETDNRSHAFAEFDRFWSAYPRKVGKGAAQKAWRAATKKAAPDTIIAAVQRFPWSDEQQFIPHPSTWLNAERWNDEVVQPNQKLIVSEEERLAFERKRQEWLKNLAMKTSV